VLRRTLGPKRDEVTGGWRKLNNEEPYNLHSSPSIIRIIKSRKMKWAGHVEDGIFHSYRRENLKSYIALSGWAL
jgi:hypothetical protein